MDEAALKQHLDVLYPDRRTVTPRYWRGAHREPRTTRSLGSRASRRRPTATGANASGQCLRLPRREEWQLASVRGAHREGPLPSDGNLMEQHIRGICPTGVFVWESSWGDLFDFVGNVGEWLAPSNDVEGAGNDEPRSGRGHGAVHRLRAGAGWPDTASQSLSLGRYAPDLRVRDTGCRLLLDPSGVT